MQDSVGCRVGDPGPGRCLVAAHHAAPFAGFGRAGAGAPVGAQEAPAAARGPSPGRRAVRGPGVKTGLTALT